MPKGTPVDITIGGPACIVPVIVGQTPANASDVLDDADCLLGDVTTGPDGGGPGDPGTIQTQEYPPGTVLPADTKVDVDLVPGGDTNIVAASTSCTVPNLVGMNEADARSKVEAAGCVLVAQPKNTNNANEIGKVITQNPGADATVPRGSPVKVDLGVQVLGDTLTNSQQSGAAAAPNLARTGGVVLGGLSLWLLLVGLATRLAGSDRLWRLVRRRTG